MTKTENEAYTALVRLVHMCEREMHQQSGIIMFGKECEEYRKAKAIVQNSRIDVKLDKL